MKSTISKYVVDVPRNCYKSEDLYTLPNTIEFPYRKDYLGDTQVKYMLDHIFKIEPVIKTEKWSIPEGKVVNRVPIFKRLYYLTDTVVSSISDHWIYDQIVDYYCEYARIKASGYGERYSAYEYWTNPELHKRWNHSLKKYVSLEDIRESIYKNNQEARPAYSLISKSLYKALMNLHKRDTYKILDIAAYGERCIAAASLSNVSIYDGVDPNYDLIQGHDLLAMDLQTMSECNIRFIHVGMEDFKSSRKYDIITYSPPPFNMEPYGPGQQTQSYMKYPTFEEYFTCFLVELVYKAKLFSSNNAIFSFSALDRNSKFPPRIDSKYISNNLELIYVEALLLAISCFGFQYQGAIGLAAGGKSAGVPWWTFKYINNIDVQYLTLLKDHYNKLYHIVVPRLASIYYDTHHNIDPFMELIVKTKTKQYYVSSFLQRKSNVILELIRLQIQQYVIEIISTLSGLRIDKIRVLLGRYLMMKSINATYYTPWKSCLYVDPVFPTKDNNQAITEQLLSYFIEQGIDPEKAKHIIYKYKYWFASYECIGIEQLYHTIAHYIHTLPWSQIQFRINRRNNMTVINGNNECVELFKRIPKGRNECGITNELWKGTHNIDILPYLRYETLGAQGHQYTRPLEKTKAIEKIFKMPIIDIYASIYNNQSKQYCSIYPDVEEDSIGSAFCLRMIEGAYLANPVDVPIFLEKALDNIISDLNNAKAMDKLLLISMNFTVWTDVESYFVDDFNTISYNILFKKSNNRGLNILTDSEYILAVYILDKNKYPSILMEKVGNRSNTVSVGVLLGTQKDTIDYDSIKNLVEHEKYIQINK